MSTIGIIGIVVSMILLAFMCFKNVNIYVTGIVCSLVIALTNGMDLIGSLKDVYMPGFGGFVSSYFLMFLIGALFGKVIEITGMARAIANLLIRIAGRHALYAIPVLIGLLVYGGVNGYVGVFTAMPIIIQVFRKNDIPAQFMPVAFMFSADTWSNCGIGSPNMLNYITCNTMGVPLTAAPTLGIVAMLINFLGGEIIMGLMVNHAKKKGAHWVENPELLVAEDEDKPLPNGVLSLLPLLTVFISINITIDGAAVIPVELGLFLGMIVAIVIGFKYIALGEIKDNIETAAKNTLGMVGTVAAVTGYGAMIKGCPSFDVITDAVTSIPGNPLFGLVIATSVLAACTCSGTAAASTALPVLSPIYLGMGLDPAVIARMFSISACSWDMVPHNGFCNMMISQVCKTTYKDAYLPVALTCVVLPFVAAIICACLGAVIY